MAANVSPQNSFATVMTRISVLPANQRVDALLNIFVDVLNAMDSGTVRKLRDQIMERFSMCGCSFDTCVLMIEFINGHLALRERGRGHHATGPV